MLRSSQRGGPMLFIALLIHSIRRPQLGAIHPPTPYSS